MIRFASPLEYWGWFNNARAGTTRNSIATVCAICIAPLFAAAPSMAAIDFEIDGEPDSVAITGDVAYWADGRALWEQDLASGIARVAYRAPIGYPIARIVANESVVGIESTRFDKQEWVTQLALLNRSTGKVEAPVRSSLRLSRRAICGDHVRLVDVTKNGLLAFTNYHVKDYLGRCRDSIRETRFTINEWGPFGSGARTDPLWSERFRWRKYPLNTKTFGYLGAGNVGYNGSRILVASRGVWSFATTSNARRLKHSRSSGSYYGDISDSGQIAYVRTERHKRRSTAYLMPSTYRNHVVMSDTVANGFHGVNFCGDRLLVGRFNDRTNEFRLDVWSAGLIKPEAPHRRSSYDFKKQTMLSSRYAKRIVWGGCDSNRMLYATSKKRRGPSTMKVRDLPAR